MPINAAHWTVNGVSGDIRYIGPGHEAPDATYNPVVDLARWLSDLADDGSSSGDDLLNIANETPSNRRTNEIIELLGNYNIDDTAAEHLYGGSIIQNDGNEVYDGIVNFGNATHIEIIQNGTFIENDFWNSRENFNGGDGASHRFLIKTITSGNDIDGRRLIGISREYGFTYSEFTINQTQNGNNVLALSQLADLNNQTAANVVATWTDIDLEAQGNVQIDANGDGNNESYWGSWTQGSRGPNDLYERIKWLIRRGTTSTLPGITASQVALLRGITHEVPVTQPTPSQEMPRGFSTATWNTGTGLVFSLNGQGTNFNNVTNMWMQLLTGTPPTGNASITIDDLAGALPNRTLTTNGAVIERTIVPTLIGSSTGSAILGSYGFGRPADELTASDRLTSLDGVQRTPPNNVVFFVTGLVAGEDRVLVGPENDSARLDLEQFEIASALSGATTAITMTTAIPTDTPSAGTIRVQLDNGIYVRIVYSSYSGSTFMIDSTVFSPDVSAGNNAFISYIDLVATSNRASFTSVYSADRGLFVRVRDGGNTPIRTFETTATLGNAGGSSTAIRTSDA